MWLVVISAILYVIPFIDPPHFWWFVFLFPVPLLYVALHIQLTFAMGYLWGLVTFGLHLSGVIAGMVGMARGPLLLKIIPGITLVLYEACYGAIWFWSMRRIQNLLRIPQYSVQLLMLWVVSLWVYFYVIDLYCLWIFGRAEGYMLMHPLLPLAIHPQLLRLLPIIGKQMLSLMLYSVAGALTLVIMWRTRIAYIILICSVLPWIISYMMPVQTPVPPAWLSRVISYTTIYPAVSAPMVVARGAADDFKQLLYVRADADIIVLPESALYAYDIFAKADCMHAWCAEALGRPVHIIAGSFGWNNGCYHNCAYLVHDGTLQMHHAKRHAMPLTERLPAWLHLPWLHNLYFATMPAIVASDYERSYFILDDDVRLVPYICSELFFNEYPDDAYSMYPIISLTNDVWCPALYVKQLLYLAARFKAIQWQRSILYISYAYATWFDCWGNETIVQAY